MPDRTLFAVGGDDGYRAKHFHRLSQGADAGGMDAVIVSDHDVHVTDPFVL